MQVKILGILSLTANFSCILISNNCMNLKKEGYLLTKYLFNPLHKGLTFAILLLTLAVKSVYPL